MLGTLPPPIPLGNQPDFIAPLRLPQDVYTGVLRQGIPEVCWTGNGFPFVDSRAASAVTSCCLRLAYMQVITLLYIFENTTVKTFFTTWLGAGATYRFVAQLGERPAGLIVKTALFAIVFVTGTDNFEQAATQAFEGPFPPSNQGGVNSLPLWGRTAEFYFAEMRDFGIAGDLPIVVVGHSYGAAVCAIMATRMRQIAPNREITIFTFAMPKPGDQALVDLLFRIDGIHVANDGDLVTIVPINIEESLPFFPAVGVIVRNIWNRWASLPTYLRLDIDGNETFGNAQSPAFDILAPIVARALAHLPLEIGTPHTVAEYMRRQSVFCKGPCWPIEKDAWDILFADQFRNKSLALGKTTVNSQALVMADENVVEGALVLSALAANTICETATVLENSGEITCTVAAGDQLWYRFPVPAGQYQHVRLVGNTDPAQVIQVLWGENCGDLHQLFSLRQLPPPEICGYWPPEFFERAWYLIVEGDGTGTFAWGPGICP